MTNKKKNANPGLGEALVEIADHTPHDVMPSVTQMLDAAQAVRDAVKQLNRALAIVHSLKIKASVVRDQDHPAYNYGGTLPLKSNPPVFKVKSMVIDL